MIRWLYIYIFRGIGIVMVIGMITILLLAVLSQMRQPQQGQRLQVQRNVVPAKAGH
jgi:hypothetical protein